MHKEKIEYVANVLKALGHPTRIEMVSTIVQQGRCNVTFLEERLNLKQSNTSQHLNCLKNVGIVNIEREGNENYYEISDSVKEYIHFLIAIVQQN
ncbi:MAG: metalloregulator ArsR/SmtB family transcription factor [Lachnospiraceae bacterium]|nr:metalloregulator ArsR/SmtB family transcription factor [Lachnospiraceae bacterium]